MRYNPRRRIAFLVAALLPAAMLTATLTGVVTSRPAAAAEVFEVPSGGVYTVSGHGYGHGRGMSQWGAYGMATVGKTAPEILDFYYPGTQTTSLSNPNVKVLLTRTGGADLTVVAGIGNETVTDAGHANAKTALPTSVGGATVTKWKAERNSSNLLALSGFWSNAWHPFPTTGQLTTPGPLAFSTDSGNLRVLYPDNTQNEYAGTLQAVVDGSIVRGVNVVPMETYLKSVVPKEMPSSWPTAAIQAQSVAARTYAARTLGGAVYDICDSSSCQMYTGVASYDSVGNRTGTETSQANAAITATANQIRTYGGAAIFAQYSSSDGGWTVGGSSPYQVAQADPFDTYSPYHNWTVSLSSSAIQAAYPSIGTLRDVAVNQRDGNGDWGGRVVSLTIDGSSGSTTVTGDSFRAAMGLRSNWFTFGDANVPLPADAGYLHALSPARILDTRNTKTPFGPAETRTVTVAGLGGVPAGAVGAVLNVTVTDTTGASYLTVWPSGISKPGTSNLNWDVAGQTVANLVYTKLGADGDVRIYNNQNNASVIVDVFGYFATADVPGGLGFVPVTPKRVLDTRYSIGGPAAPIPPHGTRTIAVAGDPATGVDAGAEAVMTNLTVTRPTAESYLTMWPAGTAMPATSNINMLPNDTRANAALGVLGAGGLSLYNNLGNSDAIIDVMGEFLPADGVSGQYIGVQPMRLLDTRTPVGAHQRPMAQGETFALPILGRGGVPTTGVRAVALNITAVAPTAPTYVTVWASGIPQPFISNVNAGPGKVVPNLVVTGVGSDGKVALYNNLGSTHLIVDVVGWISG